MSAVSTVPSTKVAITHNDVALVVPESTKLGNYVVQRLTDHQELEDSDQRKCVRKVLEIAAVCIVTGARVGMTMICLTGSAEILNEKISDPGALSMGIINSAGAVVSFGVLSLFTKFKIIDVVMRNVPDNEQVIISDDLAPCTRTAIKTASVVFGFSSQIPMAIGAFNAALFWPGVMGVFTFLDGGRSSWSVYNTITAAIQLRVEPKTGIKAQLIACRKMLVKKIETFRQLMANTPDENAGLLDKSVDISGLDANKLDAFLQKILLNTTQPPKVAPLSRGASWMVEGAIVVMASSVLAEFYKLGEDGMKQVTDNTGAQIAVATYVTLANANLWYNLVSRTTHAALNILRGITPPSLTRKISPTFYERFTKWGTWISVPTFVPSVYFAKLYFPQWAYYPVASLSSIAAFLGGLSALHGLRDIIIRRRNKNNPEIRLDDKLEKVSGTLAKANLKEIAMFLTTVSEEVRSELKAPSLDELNGFINS